MADQTALAQADDSNTLSESDLRALLDAPITVASPVAPVVTPNANGANSATPEPKVTTLTIAGEELTPAQIEARLAQPTISPEMQQKLGIADAFLALPEDQRLTLVDVAEQLRQGKNPLQAQGPRKLAVNEIDIPAGSTTPSVAWDDMSDGEKQVYAIISGYKADTDAQLKKLAGIITGMQQTVGTIHAKTQDQTTAEAMIVKGFAGCTAADVAAWRAEGIADPIKAAEKGYLKPKAAAVATPAAPAAVTPEAPSGGQQKFYDSKTPGLTVDQENRLLQAGFLPSDPKDREALLKARGSKAKTA